MIKGVLVGFGIMLLLALIPIVHFVGIPFGPFIGGYFGITSAASHTGSHFTKALVFGSLLGVLVFLVGSGVGVILTVFTQFNLVLVWIVVVVFTFDTVSMGALGAMYAQLRAAN